MSSLCCTVIASFFLFMSGCNIAMLLISYIKVESQMVFLQPVFNCLSDINYCIAIFSTIKQFVNVLHTTFYNNPTNLICEFSVTSCHFCRFLLYSCVLNLLLIFISLQIGSVLVIGILKEVPVWGVWFKPVSL